MTAVAGPITEPRASTTMVLVGTRPEAIKLAPVVRALRAAGEQVRVVSSGQHRELIDDLLPGLEAPADADLAVMRPSQSLSSLTARLLEAVSAELAAHRTHLLVVQGDTTTALAGALAGFYAGVPIAHVEAGLRSGRRDNPFPEEANRQLISRLATWHFAPTVGARNALLEEGIDESTVEVTGNTVIDNLLWVLERSTGVSSFRTYGSSRRRLLLTLHRRENQGSVMTGLAAAVGRLTIQHDLEVVFPVHPNPAVRSSVMSVLERKPNVRLIEPLHYFDFTATLATADLVVTDSGGVQEEAPTLGKPVLVVRDTTERPEAVQAGCACLVGTDPAELEAAVSLLLTDSEHYQRMARPANPFGDGNAAGRIVSRLVGDLAYSRPSHSAPHKARDSRLKPQGKSCISI